MGDTKKSKKDSNKKEIGLKREVITIGLLLISTLFIGIALGVIINNKVPVKDNNKVDLENTNITTYVYDSTILEGVDANEIKSKIINELDRLGNNSNYIQVQTGENSYETYMYNSKGECFAETSDGIYLAIHRNDNKTIKFSSEAGAIAVGDDIEILDIAKCAIKAVNSDIEGVTLYKMTNTDTESKVSEYRVDLVGKDAVKACYNIYGDEKAELMYESLVESSPDWEPHLIMVYVVSPVENNDNNEQEISLGMHCYYVEDDLEKTSWVMQGYVELDDWQLSNDWYTTDFSSIEPDIFDSMVSNLTNKLATILENYIKDNNLEVPENIESETIIEDKIEN